MLSTSSYHIISWCLHKQTSRLQTLLHSTPIPQGALTDLPHACLKAWWPCYQRPAKQSWSWGSTRSISKQMYCASLLAPPMRDQSGLSTTWDCHWHAADVSINQASGPSMPVYCCWIVLSSWDSWTYFFDFLNVWSLQPSSHTDQVSPTLWPQRLGTPGQSMLGVLAIFWAMKNWYKTEWRYLDMKHFF